jgi:hypothetical protein
MRPVGQCATRSDNTRLYRRADPAGVVIGCFQNLSRYASVARKGVHRKGHVGNVRA